MIFIPATLSGSKIDLVLPARATQSPPPCCKFSPAPEGGADLLPPQTEHAQCLRAAVGGPRAPILGARSSVTFTAMWATGWIIILYHPDYHPDVGQGIVFLPAAFGKHGLEPRLL